MKKIVKIALLSTAGVIVLAGALNGCSSTDNPSAAPAPVAAVTVTAAPAAPITVTAEPVAAAPVITPAVPATPAPVVEPVTPAAAAPAVYLMPEVTCMNLQDAQNKIQAAGVFYSKSIDASGQGRHQVIDSNWIVTSQNIAAGTPFGEGDAVLSAVKTDEPNDCS